MSQRAAPAGRSGASGAGSFASDVVTVNREFVRAESAVIFYTTADGRLCYVYDTQHRELVIGEPFTSLGNSGQVWKFCDVALLQQTVEALGAELCDDTNLTPVMHYFAKRDLAQVAFIVFDAWFNCNTGADYHAIRRYKESHAQD